MKSCLTALFAVAACGGGTDNDRADAPADADSGWTTLVSRSWSMPGGGEGYKCRRIQITEDMWIAGYRSLSPTGTHHEVITIDPNNSKSGDYDCTVSSGNNNTEMLFAAGVNTNDLLFPDGVAIHLTAGQYINLNLHLNNNSDDPITGDSGVQVKVITPGAVVQRADMVFAGTETIYIPSDGQPHTAVGGCTAPADWHVFSLWPHMHQLGTHQKMVVTHNGVATALLDQSYSFTEQKNYPMADTLIAAGDQVAVTCTYVNNTGSTVVVGDSSDAEMCFTGMYRYPAGGPLLGCVN